MEPEKKLLCPKRHQLTLCIRNYICDVCRKKCGSSKSHACVACDYDMCLECAQMDEYLRFINQIEFFEKALEKGKNDFKSIVSSVEKQSLNWMDSLFRPGNKQRQKEVLQLSMDGYKSCSNILKKIQQIKKIDKKTFDFIESARSTGKDLGAFKFAADSISLFSTIASGLVAVCAFLVGEAAITWPILVFFTPVVAVMKGLEVHERYTQFEQMLKKLRPAIKQLKEVESKLCGI